MGPPRRIRLPKAFDFSLCFVVFGMILTPPKLWLFLSVDEPNMGADREFSFLPWVVNPRSTPLSCSCAYSVQPCTCRGPCYLQPDCACNSKSFHCQRNCQCNNDCKFTPQSWSRTSIDLLIRQVCSAIRGVSAMRGSVRGPVDVAQKHKGSDLNRWYYCLLLTDCMSVQLPRWLSVSKGRQGMRPREMHRSQGYQVGRNIIFWMTRSDSLPVHRILNLVRRTQLNTLTYV